MSLGNLGQSNQDPTPWGPQICFRLHPASSKVCQAFSGILSNAEALAATQNDSPCCSAPGNTRGFPGFNFHQQVADAAPKPTQPAAHQVDQHWKWISGGVEVGVGREHRRRPHFHFRRGERTGVHAGFLVCRFDAEKAKPAGMHCVLTPDSLPCFRCAVCWQLRLPDAC